MLKFKIIKGKNQKESDSNNQLPLQEEKYPLDTQDTTILIITDICEQNTMGGISLVKRDLNTLKEDIRRLIPEGTFNQGYVWEGSTMYFTASHETPSTEKISRYFFRSLYEGLVEFGQQKGIGYIIVKLTPATYPSTKEIGLWPYVIQFLPQDLPGDFFYGILPLRGYLFEK